MMKRFIFFLPLIALPVLINAQSRDITILWEKSAISVENEAKIAQKRQKTIDLAHLGPDFMHYDLWQDTGFANGNSLVVSNVTYGSVSQADLRGIDRDLIPSELKYNIQSSRARDIIYTTVGISPVIQTSQGYRKVLSYSISYSYSAQRGANPRIPLSNSVLASGSWFKFRVDQTGVYRIDRNFLSDLGMNVNGINPRNIKIYGNGGKPLPLFNEDNTIFDLPENAIQVVGEEDGSFDSGDYILFYGIGTLGYDAENDSNINPYSDEAYYYITADGGSGRRILPMVEPSGSPNVTISQYHDYKFHEEDEFTPAKVGRQWYGNRFDIESEQSYEFEFPNIVSGTQMEVRIKVAAASESSTSMALSVNGVSLNPLTFSPIDDPTLLVNRSFVGDIAASGETVTVDLAYNNSGNPSSIGYINYISVEALRQLTGTGEQFSFRFNDVETLSGIGEYQLSNASGYSQIWDVTNTANISAITNDGGATVNFKANLGELRQYIAVHPANYFAPIETGNSRVVNQDLKGTIFNGPTGFEDLDYLIVTSPFLIQPALRLADHHRNLSGLRVKVVTTDKIYTEFSSGKQDIGAIRNFVKYIYDNASNPANRIKYVCLFGDTSVDYKDRLAGNNNIVPTFHRLESTSTFTSFMSDDYFGFMDPNEGNAEGGDKLDIAVGRILADEVGLANTLVDKIINYASRQSFGNWRNNFVLVSDDVDAVFEYNDLEVSLDALGDEITNQKPFINVKKIHSDAFQQESSAGGDRYPKVTEAITNAIEVGALVLNYFGHGGEDGLAKEFIVTKPQVQSLRNPNNLALIVTVTCEYSKFDLPTRTTAGELTYWNAEGGAIAMITTTRSIGVSLGVRFNEDLATELFGFGTNTFNTPAEALRRAKNQESSSNRRVIFYVGDPAMPLAFPKQQVRLTTLNGVPIAQATDTLKALGRVRLGGEVVDEFGNLLTDYNGVLEAKLFDKNVQRQTLGNDGVQDPNTGELLILDFITLGEGLFNGQATVTNGLWEVEFVMPRDTQIPVDKGRLSLYASRNNQLEDQTGFNLDLNVGGLNMDAPEDNTGPTIRLFMNDETFVSGGVTNDSPILIAKLEDENGINTASGIGHDLIAILDGDEANPIVVNEYYQAEVDDFTRGTTTYRLRDLEEGLHTLTFKAWDVYNNSSTAEIQFIVAGDNSLEISRILNYPNPFVNYTEFWFNHNRPFEPLEVQVQVFTVTGKVVWTKNQIVTTDGFLSRDVVWDGRDDFGDRIGKGVYVYKITVKSTLTNQRVEKFEKLVIL